MTKKIAIGTKPTNKPAPAGADAWVESRDANEPEKMKRLTIDVPERMHRHIKTQCAMNGTKIVDVVRELLIQKFGNV